MKLNVSTMGAGEPIFFQHGLGGNSEKAIRFMSGLEGYRIIAADSAGHGQSPIVAPEQVSFEQFAEHIIGIADELHIEKAIFGGISMGAGIALNLALRYPHRVKALILVRPAWLWEAHPAHLDIAYQLASKTLHHSWDNWQQSPPFEELLAQYPYLREQCEGTIHAPAHFKQLCQKIVRDKPLNTPDELKKINIHVLILACAYDYWHPVGLAETLAQHIKNAQYKQVPPKYLDEMAYQTQCTALIKAFLSEVLVCHSVRN